MTEGLGLLVQRNTWIPACAGMTEKGRDDNEIASPAFAGAGLLRSSQ